MAETLNSPGVLARENDSSFTRQQPIKVGAAIIGPTVKGPVEIPTIVTTYSEYVNKFGDVLTSGSDTYSYFTSIAAYNYFASGGETMLVTRVVSGSYTPAISTNITNNVASVIGNYATASYQFSISSETGSYRAIAIQINGNDYYFAGANFQNINGPLDYYYFNAGSNYNLNTWGTALAAAINDTNFDTHNFIQASWSVDTLYLSGSTPGIGANGIQVFTEGFVGWPTSSMALSATLEGGTINTLSNAFVLETISEGVIMNSSSSLDSQGALELGTSNNIRWQIVNPNTSSGTFGLLIRQGNDITNNPVVLETWTNLSLDPYSPNYVSKVLGDYKYNYNPNNNQIEVSGSYPNASKYVRVKSVLYNTPNYLDNAGNPKPQYTGSIPLAGSGSFTGATGDIKNGTKFYNDVIANNTQGLEGANYNDMISLLSNKNDYQFNMLLTPGLFSELHTLQTNNIIANTQNRGDNIYILDLVDYADNVTNVVSQAASLDTSYAASYWPWVQIKDPGTGKNVWVPASTVIAGVYAYNDKVSEPWFAPAGMNRGALSRVIRTEQRLSQSARDILYNGKVNPIATFPKNGNVVYGQKTLQTRPSALDRINVRRLLIELKSYISQIADNLVFDQNVIATRNQFLTQVNPYLESVQQKQGLYAFRVIMDDSNNGGDVIDRNELIGQLYLQPTKTAEFIYLDFNITPTGATFPV